MPERTEHDHAADGDSGDGRTERVATDGRAEDVAGERVGDARPPASSGSDAGLIDDSDRMPEGRDLPSQPPTR
jgi:hypothetical protein